MQRGTKQCWRVISTIVVDRVRTTSKPSSFLTNAKPNCMQPETLRQERNCILIMENGTGWEPSFFIRRSLPRRSENIHQGSSKKYVVLTYNLKVDECTKCNYEHNNVVINDISWEQCLKNLGKLLILSLKLLYFFVLLKLSWFNRLYTHM